MLDDTNDNLFFLVNALAIDMDWKYVIQPVPEGTLYDEEHSSYYDAFSVSYPHEDYYAGVSWLDSNYYKYIKFMWSICSFTSIGGNTWREDNNVLK